MGDSVPVTERAARLLVDLLSLVHESLLGAALNDDRLLLSAALVSRLDTLADSIATVRVSGDVELSEEGERTRSSKDAADIGIAFDGKPNLKVSVSSEQGDDTRKMLREVRRGAERISLNFSQIARALRDIAQAMSTKRIWLLLDEWSSVPLDVQPLLGEFLVRCVLPLQMFTVKIGAIEQQTNFRTEMNGGMVGIELGADVAANVDLDELMVYEQNEERSSAFFRGLLFKHLTPLSTTATTPSSKPNEPTAASSQHASPATTVAASQSCCPVTRKTAFCQLMRPVC